MQAVSADKTTVTNLASGGVKCKVKHILRQESLASPAGLFAGHHLSPSHVNIVVPVLLMYFF